MGKSIRIISLAFFIACITASSYGGCSSDESGSSRWPIVNAPSDLTITLITGTHYRLSWTDNAYNEDGFEQEATYETETGITVIVTTTASDITTFNTYIPDETIFLARVRSYRVVRGTTYYSEYSNEVSLNR